MTDAPYDRENFCYRHPDRQSFILCQRCGRTICTSCQTQAAVGVHCPECVREAKQNAPKRPPINIRAARAMRGNSGQPVVTYSIIAVAVVVYLLQLLLGSTLTQELVYFGPYTLTEPWRIVTSMFAHGSPIHLLFNMFSLFVLGRILEPAIGRARFAALYFISGFGGVIAVLVLSPYTSVLGASGAIFGMLAALFVIQRRLGGNTTQLLIVIGLNLVIGFFVSGISWQAHVGGLLAGAAIAFIIVRTRNVRQARLQALMIAGVAVALAVIGLVRLSI